MATYLRDPCREQALIEKRSLEARERRLLHVATADPEVPIPALSERFGWPPTVVAEKLRRAGINADRRDGFGADWNRQARRRRKPRDRVRR